MDSKLDIKDWFNNIISGAFWLILFIQSDILFNKSKIYILLKTIDLNILSGMIVIITIFIIGIFFRVFEIIPIKIHNLILGDPFDYVFKNKNDNLIRRALWIIILKKKKIPLNKIVSNKVDDFFEYYNLNNIKKTKNRVIYIENYHETLGKPKEYERMKNYKNLIESIIFPMFLNAFLGFILLDKIFDIRFHYLFKIVLLLFLLIIVSNRYEYYKINYIKKVLRSIIHVNNYEK